MALIMLTEVHAPEPRLSSLVSGRPFTTMQVGYSLTRNRFHVTSRDTPLNPRGFRLADELQSKQP